MTFFARMFTLFLALERPVSTSAKPGCIAKTRTAPSSIQRLFIVNISALTDAALVAAAAAAATAGSAAFAASSAASGNAAVVAANVERNILFIVVNSD